MVIKVVHRLSKTGVFMVVNKKCLVRETSSGMRYAPAGAQGVKPALALARFGVMLKFLVAWRACCVVREVNSIGLCHKVCRSLRS